MRRLLLTLALAAPLLSACGGGNGSDLTVVTSFYPLQWVTEQIAGDHARVENLTKPGKEPHDLELSIPQTAKVGEADLVVYVRGFQPAVDEAVDTQDPKHAVEALDVLAHDPPAIPGARPPKVIEDNPHFWLDPRALATVAAAVERQLAEIDPDHAKAYAENAARLQGDLVGLDGQLSTELDDCVRRTVVVTHQAFDYFGYRYDLDFQSMTGLSPEAEPSPAHLLELRKLVESDGITTVFTEPLASSSSADTLAGDLGLTVDTLDPVEGLSQQTKDEDYLSLMRSNGRALVKANDCTGAAS